MMFEGKLLKGQLSSTVVAHSLITSSTTSPKHTEMIEAHTCTCTYVELNDIFTQNIPYNSEHGGLEQGREILSGHGMDGYM